MAKKKEIVYLSVDEIIPYENNPRHNEEAIEPVANSIKEFGFLVPVVIDKDNVIVAGHTRILAAKTLDIEKVPCIKADDLTPEQIKAFRLADNQTGSLSSWDILKLEEEINKILDIDMSKFGFLDDGFLLTAFDDEEIISNENAEVVVRITFNNTTHFRQYEEQLRNVVDSFEDVKIVVGGILDED